MAFVTSSSRIMVMAVMLGFGLLALSGASVTGRAMAEEVATGWVGDLPVPAEALIETSDSVNFDSPSGRVVIFAFRSALDKGQIEAFYQASLSGLGWASSGAGRYERGTEMMVVEALPKQVDGRYLYQLSVKPAGQ